VNSVVNTLPVYESDVFLAVLPLFHAFGATACMLTPIALGAVIATAPRFVPDEVARMIKKTAATVFMGVPSMYALFNHLSDEHRTDFSSLRFCISGGAAMPLEVMERFEKKYGVLIYEGDGPTECSPVTAVNRIGQTRKPGSIGPAISGVEMRIVDERGESLPDGKIGEIVVRGENVMKGYFGKPTETAESFFQDWFRTGDIGYRDPDGFFYIVDRKKDVIIVNGINVYPRVIEDVLYRHPAVAEAAVVPEPHALHGEVPKAVIALKPGCTASKPEILKYCREHLGHYEVPRIVEMMPELPKTPTGKIQKRLLIGKAKQIQDS
jgi:long-chain acyl-CoA synthetase